MPICGSEIRPNNTSMISSARVPVCEGARSSVKRVAPTDASVMISGESGTGKELIARAIHSRAARSNRRSSSSIAPRCAKGLVESEFFGHERGAFSGAIQGASAALNWQTAARCSWTRSAKYRMQCRPSCCACCRSRSWNGSATTHAQYRCAGDRRKQSGPEEGAP